MGLFAPNRQPWNELRTVVVYDPTPAMQDCPAFADASGKAPEDV